MRALFDRTSSSLQPSRALCFGHAALAAPDPADRADADCCSHRRPNDCWRKSGTCSDGLDCVYHSTRSRTRGRRTAIAPMPVPPVRADARGAPAAGARRRLAVIDQLPSVGPGQVLADVISSSAVPFAGKPRRLTVSISSSPSRMLAATPGACWALPDGPRAVSRAIAVAVAQSRPDCLAGHIGLEPANPSASHLIGFA